MKALTILQPWASALVAGVKQYETRSWATPYRGTIVIHAGKKRVPKGKALYPYCAELPYGAIIGIGNLIACHHVEDLIIPETEQQWGDFTPGWFAWEFADLTWIHAPISMPGQLGLWSCPLL